MSVFNHIRDAIFSGDKITPGDCYSGATARVVDVVPEDVNTDVVRFWGCNLKCDVCSAARCTDKASVGKEYTPRTLGVALGKDGKNVVLGGGEPGLYAGFISEFVKQYCVGRRIVFETTLNFSTQDLEKLSDVVDEWRVTLFSTNKHVYSGFTNGDYSLAFRNLDWLRRHESSDDIKIRIPVVKGFLSNENADESGRVLRNMGFRWVESGLENESCDVADVSLDDFDKSASAPLKVVNVAGVSHYVRYDDPIWNELNTGDEIVLVREPGNIHDQNAIAFCLAGDYDGDVENFDFACILGYVPRTENADLAELLDNGVRLRGEIVEYCPYGKIYDRIKVGIFLDNSEEKEVLPLRAMGLDELKFKKFRHSLLQKGWVQFKPSDKFSLVLGQEVIAVYPHEQAAVMYRLRVIAVGEDCLSLGATNGVGALAANVHGPVVVKYGRWGFMLRQKLSALSLQQPLSDEFARSMLDFFEQ